MLSDGKIYFGVGNFKDVYKQMEVNPNIEIVAWNGEKFLRYYGKANLDYNPEIVDKAFELMPEIGGVILESFIEGAEEKSNEEIKAKLRP